jgi:hypothetical protein
LWGVFLLGGIVVGMRIFGVFIFARSAVEQFEKANRCEDDQSGKYCFEACFSWVQVRVLFPGKSHSPGHCFV